MSGHEPAALAEAALAVIEKSVLPLTTGLVAQGNKIFGGAVLRQADLSLVVAGSNQETECPLWHGEVSTIRRFYELSVEARPDPKECVFVSTHEPCAMCLAAIAWAGFSRFVYLFDYQQTADEFAIPHDLDMLAEIFGCANGGYTRDNAYWHADSMDQLIDASAEELRPVLIERVAALTEEYRGLSRTYQSTKASHGGTIPLS